MHSKIYASLTLVGLFVGNTYAQGFVVTERSVDGRDVPRSIIKEVVKSSDQNIDAILLKFNKMMPSKVDEMTTLTGLKRSAQTIVYEYVFNVNHSKLTIEARKDLRQKVIELTCADIDNVSYLRSGKEFLYKYSSLHGDLLLGQKVSVKYCEG